MPTSPDNNRLAPAFFRRNAVTLARALLGQRLVRAHTTDKGQVVRLAGIIVETEAYLGVEDRAAHTFGGRRTARNESMWGDGGHAYVYFTYGMHHCLNVVAGRPDHPIAVLLRALEPTEGLPHMYTHRARARKDTDLTSGPAKLCQALVIDRALDGVNLIKSQTLWIERAQARTLPASRIASAPRIGIAYAGEWKDKPLRFFIKDNPHVSRGG